MQGRLPATSGINNGACRALSPTLDITRWHKPSVVTTDRCVRCNSTLGSVRDDSATVIALRQQLSVLSEQLAELSQSNLRSQAVRVSSSIFYQRKLTKEDYDGLPHRIILLRHAESHGNLDVTTYATQPDHTVPLTVRGRKDALAMGNKLRDWLIDRQGPDFKLFLMTSPYCRTLQTTDLLLKAFTDEQIAGVRQAVQLREQDFGNFQDSDMGVNMLERQRFGRFYYRFPNGESGADVYDRLTIFEDHMTRDMLLGRFAGTSLAMITHGLTLRIFLMRWFHWSVDEFLEVFNPENCTPIVVERLSWEEVQELQFRKYAHAKHLYAITPESLKALRGCTPDMSSYFSRNSTLQSPKQKWIARRHTMSSRGLYGAYSSGSLDKDCGPRPTNYASFSFESTCESDTSLDSQDPWMGSPMPPDIPPPGTTRPPGTARPGPDENTA